MIYASKRSKAALLASSILVLGAPASAAAQETASAESGESVADANDIVVTATRKNEVVSRIPMSISAYSQDTMDTKGVKSIADVIRFTPGITFSPVDSKIAIRGISSRAGAGTTGIYIDDTPVQMRNLRYLADDAVPAIFDLDRVEVLRGPQGTLFGAGSEGGAVRYITPQPSLTEFSAYGRAEVAAVEHGAPNFEVGAAVGGPISTDKIGFRVSGYYRRDGGYVDLVDYRSGEVTAKNINDTQTTAFSAALAFQPVENLIITPSIRFQERLTGGQAEFTLDRAGSGLARFQYPGIERRRLSDRFYLPGVNVHYSTGDVDIIYNATYFSRKNTNAYDGAGYMLGFLQTFLSGNEPLFPLLGAAGPNAGLPSYEVPARVFNRQKNFTQELRVQSADDEAPLSWVLGLYYQYAKQSSRELLVDPQSDQLLGLLFGTDTMGFYGMPMLPGDISYDSVISGWDRQFAGFANVTYKITDHLKLSGGIRYGEASYKFTNFADGPFNGGPLGSEGRGKERPFTPKADITYNFDRDNLLYATWAKGYRVGGVNPPVPFQPCQSDLAALGLTSSPTNYKSDQVTNWEIGAKNKFFGNKLSVATSAYQIDWKDIQQSVNLPVCQVTFTSNLGEAKVRGFDLQFSARPSSAITIDGSVGYTHARYLKTIATSPTAIIVAEGNAVPSSPWNVNLGAQYDFQLGDNPTFVRADYQYTSSLKALTVDRDPRTTSYDFGLLPGDPLNFVSLRAGSTFDKVSVSVFIDNVFDKRPIGFQRHWGQGLWYTGQTELRPRTIGLSVSARL
jgi:outer membrane receptor protein involved in Fe transport